MAMDAALLFFGLLWALQGGRRRPTESPPAAPRALPPGLTVSTPPWPSVAPSGLPAFPGSGWEYDEPPPRAVQVRAGELRSKLWARGKGSHQIEQTGGRWIAYQAQITRGGKQGVVAYRERRAAAPRPPAGSTAQRPTAPAAPSMGAIVIPVATDPNAPNVYLMRPGITYSIQSECELPAGISMDALKQGMQLGGAKNVSIVQLGALALMKYELTPTYNAPMVIGEWITLPVGGARLRIIEIKPLAGTTPGVSPMKMPTLRRGSTGAAVGVLQRKLGISADEKFGPGTHAAVVAYQRSKGIAADGVVGPQTWTMLLGFAT